jgi:hypothetical protein
MDITAPSILVKSFLPDWMLGIYTDEQGNNDFFVTANSDFFQDSFAGMLNWEKVIIEEARAIGANGKHLKLKLNQESRIKNQGDAFDAVAFGMGEKISDLKTGSLIDIVYTIDLNVWRGKESLQLKIKDLK